MKCAVNCCVIQGVGLDPSKPAPKKAKQLRLERRLAKRSQSATAADADAEVMPLPVSNMLVI